MLRVPGLLANAHGRTVRHATVSRAPTSRAGTIRRGTVRRGTVRGATVLEVPPCVRALVLAGLLSAAAVSLGGCRLAEAEPSPTPADFAGITRVLGPHGISVDATVSGDAGCADANLARTAISFQAHGLDQPNAVAVHLYRFNDDAALQRNIGAIGTCAKSYVGDSSQFVQIVASPYVVVGQGPWGASFTQTLTDGLKAAAGSGG